MEYVTVAENCRLPNRTRFLQFFFFLYISSPKSQAIIITHRSRRYRRQKKWKWQRCLESCVVSSCVRKSSLPSHWHTTRITYTTLVSYSFHAPAQQNISHYLALILPWKTRLKMPWEMWLFHSLRPTSRAPRRKIIFIRFFVGFTAPRFTFHARLVSYFSINTPFWVTGVYNPAAPPYDDAVNTSSLRKTFDPAIYCEPQPNVLPLFTWHTRKSLIICTCSMQIFAHLHMALFITHMADGIISFWISSFFALRDYFTLCGAGYGRRACQRQTKVIKKPIYIMECEKWIGRDWIDEEKCVCACMNEKKNECLKDKVTTRSTHTTTNLGLCATITLLQGAGKSPHGHTVCEVISSI